MEIRLTKNIRVVLDEVAKVIAGTLCGRSITDTGTEPNKLFKAPKWMNFDFFGLVTATPIVVESCLRPPDGEVGYTYDVLSQEVRFFANLGGAHFMTLHLKGVHIHQDGGMEDSWKVSEIDFASSVLVTPKEEVVTVGTPLLTARQWVTIEPVGNNLPFYVS